MNEIFNPYVDYVIVYIDDVLIFSPNIDQHFKQISIFIKVIEKKGLVVSLTKISLFQTKVIFLGHYISQMTIIPIERSIQFIDKFPDKIKDKTQLQRFLSSLNYIQNFFPNMNILCKPLHQRLKKNLSHGHLFILIL